MSSEDVTNLVDLINEHVSTVKSSTKDKAEIEIALKYFENTKKSFKMRSEGKSTGEVRLSSETSSS
jgi:hypothetical protein